jgi:arylsulfatase A
MSNRFQFLRQTAAVFMASGLIVNLLPALAASGAYAAETVLRQRPNVIVVLADDLGYECLGCNGGESYDTPHLDQLAAEGVRFTHCFVNPLCTPTRLALMTGRYNFRNYTQFGMLPAGEPTFGHMLQDAGYATCIAGKWQLENPYGHMMHAPQLEENGGVTPDRAGFHEYHVSWGYADPSIADNQWERVRHKGAYGPQLDADYLCDFLERHSERPFFVYFTPILPHNPFTPTPDSPAWKSENRHEDDWRKYMSDMVAYLDKIVGQIIGKLDELGIRERTLIVFLGDNGTHTRVTSQFRGKPFQGGKSWLTDAGTHVPLIVNWKGTVEGGRVLDDLVDPTDLFVTIADATGAKPRKPSGDGVIDGVSVLSRLMGAKKPARNWVLIEYINEFREFFPEQRLAFPGQEGRYVRDHRWKLYDTGKSRRDIPFYKGGQLYDMLRDPREERPIEPGSNAEADAAREKLQAVFATYAWQ